MYESYRKSHTEWIKKNMSCVNRAQQRDVGSVLYLQNKDSNKIAIARRESKEEGKLEKDKLP